MSIGGNMLDQIKIIPVHYHLSDNTKAFLEEKLSKLDYLDEKIVGGMVKVIKEKHEYKIEADIHFKHKAHKHVHASHEQLYPAIENLVHKLKKVISDEMERINDHQHHHVDNHDDKQNAIHKLTTGDDDSETI